MSFNFLELDVIKAGVADALLQSLTTVGAGKLAPSVDRQFVFSLIEKPRDPKLGDYAFPCFRFAKDLGMKPNDIAQQVAAQIPNAQAVGAFINITVAKSEMAKLIFSQLDQGKFFDRLAKMRSSAAQRIMIEYSQPNTHKEFHVGHVRNIALGDSVIRLLRYCGENVIAANYPGDEGTHIAKCLWYMRRNNLQPPADMNKGEWLGEVYAQASRVLADAQGDDKESWNREVSEILAGIEAKSGEIYELWRETRQWSLDSFYSVYDYMDVHFDQYFFESELSADSQKIVDEYLAKGVFVESDGAIGCDLNAYDLGFLILRKRDGNTLYATKDLVLARRKFSDFNVERSVYVVAAEQTLHFRQVFKTLELMGFQQAAQCFHLSYGHVRLPEGKMSSRDGTAVTFRSLRESVNGELDKNLEKYAAEWSAEELATVKKLLCVGAIKYGMLSTDPVKDVVYVASDWVSFEGDTGPYLMYSYARTKSILRRAADLGVLPTGSHSELLTTEGEGELIRYLYDFNDAVAAAATQYKPSLLANHLFDTCRAFNRMYAQVSVLKAESKELMQARVNLLHAFSQVLAKGLNLLGMTPPEKM